MSGATGTIASRPAVATAGTDRLNGQWHHLALWTYAAIVRHVDTWIRAMRRPPLTPTR